MFIGLYLIVGQATRAEPRERKFPPAIFILMRKEKTISIKITRASSRLDAAMSTALL
jgi:hypothetical protein